MIILLKPHFFLIILKIIIANIIQCKDIIPIIIRIRMLNSWSISELRISITELLLLLQLIS